MKIRSLSTVATVVAAAALSLPAGPALAGPDLHDYGYRLGIDSIIDTNLDFPRQAIPRMSGTS